MPGKLIILIGPPGAGKSTWAADQVAKSSNAVIVGRDKLRELLFGYTEETVCQHFAHPDFEFREDEITTIQYQLISTLLKRGMHVIVDDTNCKYTRLKTLTSLFTLWPFEIRYFNTSLLECQRRISLRNRKVSDEVLEKMHQSYEMVMSIIAEDDDIPKPKGFWED